jgi:DNA replication protein DnaC
MPREKAKLHAISNENGSQSAGSQRAKNTAEPNVCKICFGTGLEIVEGKGARPCACRRRDEHGLLLKQSRIPTRYLHCDFNTYLLVDEFKERAINKALSFVNSYPNVEKGLLLTGPVGVGKTHLAVSILKGLIEQKRCRCLFYEFSSLLKEIQDSYNPNTQTSEFKLLSNVWNCDVLVLDEIGSSKTTDWVRDTLGSIIGERYNSKKITIFTTNYPDDEDLVSSVDKEGVRRAYETQEWARKISEELETLRAKNPTLQDRIGERLRSRLYEMCDKVYIGGKDFRKTVKGNTSQMKRPLRGQQEP